MSSLFLWCWFRFSRFGLCFAGAARTASAETSKAGLAALWIVLVIKAERKPILISQFNVIALEFFLIGRFVGKFDSLEGARFYAGLFAIGTALLVPKGRVDAEIAFGRNVLALIPDRPMLRLL